MKEVAKRYQDRLSDIKKKVRESHEYFDENYRRYNDFRKFVFETSLTSSEVQLLASMGRPQLEFNVLEAYISRLLGEFSKQEPDILVNAYDERTADPATIEVVQQHLKHVFMDGDNAHMKYEVYKDLLSGGFSAVKVYTEYEHAMSMDQVIRFERCEPTLAGFDKLAKLSHKGDGQYCFEMFPKSEACIKEEYPDLDLKKISFSTAFGGFNWSYISGGENIALIVDYYEKRQKEETIVSVRGMGVMLKKKYDKIVEEWDSIEMPPIIIGKPRKTLIERICRYRIIESEVIEYEETDFDMLPIVFVDGSSIMIKGHNDGAVKQVTRPYVYHARGAQRLKNYAGISLANEIENTVQHKFMVAKEALPKEEELLTAYKDVQNASVLVYNSVYEKNPSMPIMNPIREIQRAPCPPEIIGAFTGSDSLIQNVLGSYDASLGINNNQLSGVAIVEAASQSNATAMPYIVGCLQGFQRLAQIYVSLIPKYFVTPRSVPIIDGDGQRQFVRVNEEDVPSLDYDPNVLNVTLSAGASFQVQKSRTINMVKEVMGMSPIFSEFMSEKGLHFILDNMDGKGIEELKSLTAEWTEELNQRRQQAEQQPNPAQMKAETDAAKLEQQTKKDDMNFQMDMAKLNQDNKELEAKIAMQKQTTSMQLIKAMTENMKIEKDYALKTKSYQSKAGHDAMKLMHDIIKCSK